MSCWKCGKKGDFAGQVCAKCFQEMEEYHDAELTGMIDEGGDHEE